MCYATEESLIATEYAISNCAYFSFSGPSIPTVFVAWLNLDIGFDICFYNGLKEITGMRVYRKFIYRHHREYSSESVAAMHNIHLK